MKLEERIILEDDYIGLAVKMRDEVPMIAQIGFKRSLETCVFY